mmetsp:Transcript_54709/g.133783  ORF Transcript_54709/g.133783 Transcript_54709/m.133783 type:complete len:307 (-) Transcript_54709:89-1009(-)
MRPRRPVRPVRVCPAHLTSRGPRIRVGLHLGRVARHLIDVAADQELHRLNPRSDPLRVFLGVTRELRELVDGLEAGRVLGRDHGDGALPVWIKDVRALARVGRGLAAPLEGRGLEEPLLAVVVPARRLPVVDRRVHHLVGQLPHHLARLRCLVICACPAVVIRGPRIAADIHGGVVAAATVTPLPVAVGVSVEDALAAHAIKVCLLVEFSQVEVVILDVVLLRRADPRGEAGEAPCLWRVPHRSSTSPLAPLRPAELLPVHSGGVRALPPADRLSTPAKRPPCRRPSRPSRAQALPCGWPPLHREA